MINYDKEIAEINKKRLKELTLHRKIQDQKIKLQSKINQINREQQEITKSLNRYQTQIRDLVYKKEHNSQ